MKPEVEVNDLMQNLSVNASQPLARWREKGWIYHEICAARFNGIAVTTWGHAVWTTRA